MNYPCVTNLNAYRLQNRRTKTAALGDWFTKARKQILILPDEPTSSIIAIISSALNKPAHFGYSHPEFELSPGDALILDSMLNRLVSGEPLPYITGKQEFFGYDFVITPDVLIPRPETELLVEIALDRLEKKRGKILAADIGTGSGCIAASICRNLPDIEMVGTDISFAALRVAQINAENNGVTNQLTLVQTDLLTGLRGYFDCLCANLPYIPSDLLSTLAVKEFEPKSALDGGQDGLQYIKSFLYQSKSKIKSDGFLLLEMEASQSQAILDLSASVFPKASIKIHCDLAGFPRIAHIELKGSYTINENPNHFTIY
jgi:release factor glutamine methyltransferase